jgi:hypothetical protein
VAAWLGFIPSPLTDAGAALLHREGAEPTQLDALTTEPRKLVRALNEEQRSLLELVK